MADVEHQMDQTQAEPTANRDTFTGSEPPTKKKKRRWLLKLVLFLGVVGGLAAFAPQIVSRSGLADVIVNQPLQDCDARVAFRNVDLSWNGPVTLEGVSCVDGSGQQMASFTQIKSSIPLWELIQRPMQLGTWKFEGGEVNVVLTEEGVNLERAFRPLLGAAEMGGSIGQIPTGQLIVSGLTINVDDQVNGRKYALNDTTVDVIHEQASAPLKAALSSVANLQNADGQAASGQINVQSTLATTVGETSVATVNIQNTPLSLLRLIPAVAQSGVVPDGQGALTANLSWPDLQYLQAHGDARLVADRFTTLLLSGTSRYVLAGDRLEVTAKAQDLGRGQLPPIELLAGIQGTRLFTAGPALENQPPQWIPVFEEPQTQLAMKAQAFDGGGGLEIPSLQLNSQFAQANLSGDVEFDAGDTFVDFTGEARADYTALAKLFAPDLLETLRVDGMELSKVRIEGPLSTGPRATSEVRWRQARLMDVALLPGWLETELTSDKLLMVAREVRMGNGQLKAEPQVLFTPKLQFRLPAGTRLEGLSLAGETAKEALQFVSPLLADATTIEGSVNCELGEVLIDLETGAVPQLSGKVEFLSGRLGPGPGFQEIVGIVSLVRSLKGRDPVGAALQPTATWIEIPRQAVPFDVVDNRVRHNGLTYLIGNVPMVSGGSVGVLDRSIDVGLRVDLASAISDNRPVLGALAGQPVEIRIAGTLDRPRLDASAIAAATKAMGAEAAGNLIFNLLEKRRNK